VQRAADSGHTEAQATAARMLLIGIPRQDLPQAVKYIRAGASAGNRQCLELMAHIYLFGQGVTQDYSTALRYLEQTVKDDRTGRQKLSLAFYSMMLEPPQQDYKKAEQLTQELTSIGYSSAWAYGSMGLLKEFGLGTPVNYKESARWYQIGADLGDCDSQLGLAGLLLAGKGVEKDVAKGIDWLKKSAQNQLCEAQLLLAVLSAGDADRQAGDTSYQSLLKQISDRGFESLATTLGSIAPSAQKSPFKNYEEFARALAVQSDDGSDSTRLLILSFLDKYDLAGKKSPQVFKGELNRAISMGSVDAMVVKANYETSWDFGELNYTEAASFYQTAAEKGYSYAQSQLGMMYALGFGVKHDWPMCIKWLTAAAKQGDTDANYALGGFYSDGRGVVPDRKVAVQFYEKAANAGKCEGALEMAILYSADDFPDLTQDLKGSEKWFLSAADDGLQESNYFLGRLLGPKEPERAAEFYKIAAAHGHLLSQIALGRYYFHSDPNQSEKYYLMAAQFGNKEAKNSLKRVNLVKATYRANPRATEVVFALKDISKGDKLTAENVGSRAQDLTRTGKDLDAMVDLKKAIGTTANEDIQESENVFSSQLLP
jgi:FOG: TPR repeat, SEL1 subfamily